MNTRDAAERVEITQLHLIREKQVLLAHLRTFDWDYRGRFRAILRQGQVRLRTEQVGYGGVGREIFAILSPLGEWSEMVATVERMRANPDEAVYLERETMTSAQDCG